MSKKRILIVDDAQLVRNIYRAVLEGAGYEVVEAANFDQAIERMDDSIGLALLDVVLMDRSGLEVLKHIRRHFPTCPAIMISAHANKKNVLAALNEGAVQYLEKIISPVELLDSVKHWLPDDADQQEDNRLQDSG
jgi:DNA-binding NtrC family response regulator